MNTPGDDDQTPPPSTPPPPDPYRNPSDAHVEQPRFGDGGTGQYAPDYGNTPDPTQQPPPPVPTRPVPQPIASPQPDTTPATPGPPTQSRDSRKGMIAPIAAAIVLIGGIGLLILSSGSDEPETITTPRIAEVRDPDEPLVESTVPGDSVVESTVPDDSILEPTIPIQTSPPLVAQTTVPPVEPPTTPAPVDDSPASGGPTQAELDAALVAAGDLESDDWFEQEPDFIEFCDTVPDVAEPVVRADSLFGAVSVDPPGARQISNTLLSFETAELAERAFASDVEELVACDSTTTELDGDQYRVQVTSEPFTAEQAAQFPCADQSSFIIVQLTNDNLTVPYIAQSAIGFQCGRNVTVTAMGTTIDLEDLDNDDFFDAAAVSNTRAGALPGS